MNLFDEILDKKGFFVTFSSGDVMQKELSEIEGYKCIRKHLISKFMPHDRQNEWNRQIEKLYTAAY